LGGGEEEDEETQVKIARQYKGNPMPHVYIFVQGKESGTVDGANATKLLKLTAGLLESFVTEG
jgi:hypothetical protein